MCPNSALLHSKLNTFSSFFLKQYLHSTKTVSFFFFFCCVVEAGCSPGRWSGWGECRIIGAMLNLVSVALQYWGSGTWKHWLNSYQSFQTPSWRKALWASFLSGPRPVEVQRDGEACRPACVFVCVHCFWKEIRALRPEAWTIRTILFHFHSLPLSLFHTHTWTHNL